MDMSYLLFVDDCPADKLEEFAAGWDRETFGMLNCSSRDSAIELRDRIVAAGYATARIYEEPSWIYDDPLDGDEWVDQHIESADGKTLVLPEIFLARLKQKLIARKAEARLG